MTGTEETSTGVTVYLTEEMKVLRDMIRETVKAINNLQNIAVVATGSVYAFVASQPKLDYAQLALAIPIGVNVLNYVLYEGMRQDTNEMRLYISKIEGQLLPQDLGYSRFYTDSRQAQSPNMVKYARRSFWWLLIAASIAVPFVWHKVTGGVGQ